MRGRTFLVHGLRVMFKLPAEASLNSETRGGEKPGRHSGAVKGCEDGPGGHGILGMGRDLLKTNVCPQRHPRQ